VSEIEVFELTDDDSYAISISIDSARRLLKHPKITPQRLFIQAAGTMNPSFRGGTKMKRIVSVLIVCIFVIALAGCGGNSNGHETPSNSTKQEDLQKDNHDESAKAAIEVAFPVENAKRSAVVAITNGFAIDVFAEDRNTYDVSKFHSYADTSGNVNDYFMKVKSWGTWSAKNEQTWHVDSLILENSYGVVANGALDVNFDGTNYVLSNITGTYGRPGAPAGNSMDLSDIESESIAAYLTVPAKLIKNDRIQEEVDALDHSGDLDKYVARTTFEKHGKYVYPYGFECHWILDLISEEQTTEGSWTFKVGVTITNQYGTKRDTVAEGIISGNTGNPIVKEFYVR